MLGKRASIAPDRRGRRRVIPAARAPRRDQRRSGDPDRDAGAARDVNDRVGLEERFLDDEIGAREAGVARGAKRSRPSRRRDRQGRQEGRELPGPPRRPPAAQWHHRQETALAYRIRRSGLPEQWSLESFPWKRQPGVSQRQIRGFAELDFIAKAENIVFIGPTAVGKTGLASGLLLKALQNGYRGTFLRAQDLFDEMYASLADRSSRKLVDRLARVDLLVVDGMGYLNLRPEQTNIFFKLMEERYRKKATIITTNLDFEEWHNFLGNKALVTALLGRLRHQCHTVRIDGPSLREPQS